MKNTRDNCIFNAPRPLLIAGPCSAESREQVLGTARALKGLPGLLAFRAGIWKPRTRPGDFEGVGKEGLDWLREVKSESGMKLAVEVAVPAHVEEALAAGVDILWIGARTVVSPFVIDELARSLAGNKDVVVMVKNPVSPDLDLWIGGLERLKNAGVDKLAAVHRGFNTYLSKPYRNMPFWEIPIELKRLLPELPLLCDPSHIGGKRKLLASLSQKALDLGMDGLMIESHIDPENALTDMNQQLPPASLHDLVKNLKVRKQDNSSHPQLEKYRLSLDDIDEQVLELLAKRMKIAELIGEYKRKLDLAPLQPERWARLLDDRIGQATALGLEPAFVKKFLELVHMESIRMQS